MDVISLITFAAETKIHRTSIEAFSGPDSFYLQSIASADCAYGIAVDIAPTEQKQDVNAVNRKKLKTLEEKLSKRMQSVVRLQQKGRTVPKTLSDEIETLEKELQTVKVLINS